MRSKFLAVIAEFEPSCKKSAQTPPISQPPASRYIAIEHLLAATSMEDLSRMLADKSVRVTETYYAPWVPERQILLKEKKTKALKKMGVSVSTT